MSKRFSVYVAHMLDTVETLESITANCDWNDIVLRLAVERCIQIIGDASSRLPESIQSDYPDIPWRDIKSTRNFITHEYHAVEDDYLVNIVKYDIPVIKPLLLQLYDDLVTQETAS
ncbi:MAG: HepT-like ribonuclease domain-containing protein [Saprospiraceae bacterium]